MKGKEIRKEKKKDKDGGRNVKVKSDYQNEKSSKQDFTINPKQKKA